MSLWRPCQEHLATEVGLAEDSPNRFELHELSVRTNQVDLEELRARCGRFLEVSGQEPRSPVKEAPVLPASRRDHKGFHR